MLKASRTSIPEGRQRARTPVHQPAHRTYGKSGGGPVEWVSGLQRAAGNQAVLRYLGADRSAVAVPNPLPAKRKIGGSEDRLEQEADRAAGQIETAPPADLPQP